MNQPQHVFTPPPEAGQILGMIIFRGRVLVSCAYAVYELTPTDEAHSFNWIIERVKIGEPECVRY